MRKHSDGIVCSAVTVIYTSLFTTVFETPVSVSLIWEGRKVTIFDWWNAERQGMNLLRLRIDDLIEFSLAYNGTFTVCKIVGTHYGDMQARILWDSLYATEEQRKARARGHWMHTNLEDSLPIRWFPPLWCSMRHISPYVVYSFCLRLSSEFVWIQCSFALRHFSTSCNISFIVKISVQWTWIRAD